jgi:hypothetical protein
VAAWLLLQSGSRLALQDGSGFVLLQGQPASETAEVTFDVPAVTRTFAAAEVDRSFAAPAVTRSFTVTDPEV